MNHEIAVCSCAAQLSPRLYFCRVKGRLQSLTSRGTSLILSNNMLPKVSVLIFKCLFFVYVGGVFLTHMIQGTKDFVKTTGEGYTLCIIMQHQMCRIQLGATQTEAASGSHPAHTYPPHIHTPPCFFLKTTERPYAPDYCPQQCFLFHEHFFPQLIMAF